MVQYVRIPDIIQDAGIFFGGLTDVEQLREEMVQSQLRMRGITDPRVLDAMSRIQRHLYIPEPLQSDAYEDRPQKIGFNQTISQPYMVALMTQALNPQPDETILEIGTGSGYQTAVLAELCAEVISIERISTLAHRARELLSWSGYRNIKVEEGDGSRGYALAAPYSAILAAAAAPSPPAPLLEQLAPGGRLVIPIGQRERQSLKIFKRDHDGRLTEQAVCDCSFVPMLGDFGWTEDVRETMTD